MKVARPAGRSSQRGRWKKDACARLPVYVICRSCRSFPQKPEQSVLVACRRGGLSDHHAAPLDQHCRCRRPAAPTRASSSRRRWRGRAELVPVDGFSDFAAGVADEPGDLFDGDVAVGHEVTKVCQSSRGVQPGPIPPVVQTARKNRRTLAVVAVQWRCRTPGPGSGADCAYSARSAASCELRQAEGAAGLRGLGVSLARTDRHTATLAGCGGVRADVPRSRRDSPAGTHRRA